MPQRQRSESGDLGRPALGVGQGADPVGHPGHQGGFGIEFLGRQQHSPGAAVAGQRRQPADAPVVQCQPVPGDRELEVGVRGDHPQIADHGQLHTGANRRTVDCADHRHRHGVDGQVQRDCPCRGSPRRTRRRRGPPPRRTLFRPRSARSRAHRRRPPPEPPHAANQPVRSSAHLRRSGRRNSMVVTSPTRSIPIMGMSLLIGVGAAGHGGRLRAGRTPVRRGLGEVVVSLADRVETLGTTRQTTSSATSYSRATVSAAPIGAASTTLAAPAREPPEPPPGRWRRWRSRRR